VAHPTFSNHNGGQVVFGPDGMLYAGFGDGGSGGDPRNNAQNPAQKLGKLMRAAGPSFTSWAIAGDGFRNPWRFAFDSATGDLYIADVGQNEWEEVDYRAAADLPTPANYGWSRYEGTHDYNTSIVLNPPSPLVQPILEYDHSTNGDCAIIGGYVYHGSAMVDEVGRYFYTDLCTGAVRTMVVSGGVATDNRTENITVSSPSSFGLDAAGELYVASLGDGKVYRISE
jgi:glucose/arabinose dehydrogenase